VVSIFVQQSNLELDSIAVAPEASASAPVEVQSTVLGEPFFAPRVATYTSPQGFTSAVAFYRVQSSPPAIQVATSSTFDNWSVSSTAIPEVGAQPDAAVGREMGAALFRRLEFVAILIT
jgi:hypothetical protein